MEPQVEDRPRARATRPDVSQDEINEICKPLRQYAAQIRYLRDVLKLQVERRPDGSPLVWRAHLEAKKGQAEPNGAPTPDEQFNWTKK
jgi:hypothetical protein